MASSLVFLLLVAATAAADVCPGSKLTPEDRALLLSAHNEFRSKIALGHLTGGGILVPAAADMLKMEWDCELEMSAQKWSESVPECEKQHSEAGKTRPEFTGENIAWNPIQIVYKKNLSDAIVDDYTQWSGEYEVCKFHSSIFPESRPCPIGHATQMAWGSSYRLGCGINTVCATERFKPWGLSKFLVCQYADQGNIPGEPIYTEGPAASKCPEGWVGESATGLCVKEGAAPAITTTTAVHSETTTTPGTAEITTEAPTVTSTTAPSIDEGCENDN